MKVYKSKRSLFYKIIFFVLILHLAFSSNAQFTYGYEFQPKRKKVVIPFEMRNNLIIIKISINKSDTLNFILDTGLRMNLVTDPQIANSLGLLYTRKMNIMGFGENEPLTARISVNNEIDLLGVIGLRQNLVALSEDKLELSDFIGMHIHGILGLDLFGSFVVKVNFHSRTITLTNPKKYKYKKRHGQKIPIHLEEGKPYIIASTTLSDKKEIPLKLILDTGAGHGLLLEMAGNPEIELPEKTIPRLLGQGLNGKIYGEEGRIETFHIGNYTLHDVITSFPDTNTKSSKRFRNTNRQGNLGCEVMNRFNVIFNYQKGYAVFKPNRKALKQTFERDMSGMVIAARGENHDKYIVENVYIGSPAQKAGIELGDELLFVNNKKCKSLNLHGINQQLIKGDGKKLEMVIRRNTELLKIEFVLKRMI